MCVGNSDIRKKERESMSMRDVTLKALRFHAVGKFTYQGPSIDSSKKGVGSLIWITQQQRKSCDRAEHKVNLNLKSSWLGLFDKGLEE